MTTLLNPAALIKIADDLGNPVEIYFGRGGRDKLKNYVTASNSLIVTSHGGRARLEADINFMRLLPNSGVYWHDSVQENPDIEDLEFEALDYKGFGIDTVVAIGGGSVMDTAKAFAYILAYTGHHKFSDLIKKGEPIRQGMSKTIVALPTTSGTGSEVTPFATVWDKKMKKKYSLSGSGIYPKIAIVDPFLTDSVPIRVTISTALDALNQSFESVWNKNADARVFTIASSAIKLSIEALSEIALDKTTPNIRDKLSQASLLSGLLISKTRTALCHSISYPLTINFGIPHGIACAFTMPSVLEYNLKFDDGRLSALSKELGFQNEKALVIFLHDLNIQLGVDEVVKVKTGSLENILSLHEEMITPERSLNNIGPVTYANVKEILQKSWIAA